jgi:hypothetical protein
MIKKIDFMIAGAQKAGTTSMLHYLGEHPDAASHPQKEFAYFLDPIEYEQGYNSAFRKYYSIADVTSKYSIIAKSATLYANEDAIKRLYDHNPACKILLILRNPSERAYSSYLMERNHGSIHYEFNQILPLLQKKTGWEYEVFINYGLYEKHLSKIYKYFPKEQVQIVLFEEVKENASTICQTIFSTLGLDNSFLPNVAVKHNTTQRVRSKTYAVAVKNLLQKRSLLRKVISIFIPSNRFYKYGNAIRGLNKTKLSHVPMDTDTYNRLTEFYAPHNLSLAKMIGKDLSDWNKTC